MERVLYWKCSVSECDTTLLSKQFPCASCIICRRFLTEPVPSSKPVTRGRTFVSSCTPPIPCKCKLSINLEEKHKILILILLAQKRNIIPLPRELICKILNMVWCEVTELHSFSSSLYKHACGSVFHLPCFMEWAANMKHCPKCSSNVSLEQTSFDDGIKQGIWKKAGAQLTMSYSPHPAKNSSPVEYNPFVYPKCGNH